MVIKETKLSSANNDEIEIVIPVDTWEMTYAQSLDFAKAEGRYFEAGRKKDLKGKSIQALCKALELAGIRFQKGSWADVPFTIDNESFLNAGSVLKGISVTRLYRHISDIMQYQGSESVDNRYLCEYKGVMYYIDPRRGEVLAGKKPAYTLGEVLEVQETKRIFTADILKRGDEDGAIMARYSDMIAAEPEREDELRAQMNAEIWRKGDPEGDLEMQMMLRVLAVLMRKEGEELPFEGTEEWIEERGRHFIDMPLQVVKDAAFFLIGIIEVFAAIRIIRERLKKSALFTLRTNTTRRHKQRRKGKHRR